MKIFLTGFMGSGKSTLGSSLAENLKIPFFDLDSIIQHKLQMSITEIFRLKGEEEFRKLETEILSSCNNSGVYATGGGIITIPENHKIIRKQADLVIWLNPSWNIIYNRIKNSDRPLIINKSEKELKELYKQREILYQGIADIIYRNSSVDGLVKLIACHC